MPSDWLTAYRPRRYPILDASWHLRDRDWEYDLVEHLRRGCAAPRSLSVYELIPDNGPSGDGSWEAAEKHAKDAIRTGAAFLDDTSIKRRLADRKRRKAAYAQWKIVEAARLAKIRAEREAQEAEQQARVAAILAEQEREQREWREKMIAHKKAEVAREAEWLAAEPPARRLLDQVRIMASRWCCTRCGGVAKIEIEGDGYLLTCGVCGKQGYGSHEKMRLAK